MAVEVKDLLETITSQENAERTDDCLHVISEL